MRIKLSKLRRSQLKARRTILRKDLEALEAMERRVVNHTPRGGKWATGLMAGLQARINKLTEVLGDSD